MKKLLSITEAAVKSSQTLGDFGDNVVHYVRGLHYYSDRVPSTQAIAKKKLRSPSHATAFEHIKKVLADKSPEEAHHLGKHYAYWGDDKPENKHPQFVHNVLSNTFY